MAEILGLINSHAVLHVEAVDCGVLGGVRVLLETSVVELQEWGLSLAHGLAMMTSAVHHAMRAEGVALALAPMVATPGPVPDNALQVLVVLLRHQDNHALMDQVFACTVAKIIDLVAASTQLHTVVRCRKLDVLSTLLRNTYFVVPALAHRDGVLVQVICDAHAWFRQLQPWPVSLIAGNNPLFYDQAALCLAASRVLQLLLGGGVSSVPCLPGARHRQIVAELATLLHVATQPLHALHELAYVMVQRKIAADFEDDPWEEESDGVHGGTPRHARWTLPLLQSPFSPASPQRALAAIASIRRDQGSSVGTGGGTCSGSGHRRGRGDGGDGSDGDGADRAGAGRGINGAADAEVGDGMQTGVGPLSSTPHAQRGLVPPQIHLPQPSPPHRGPDAHHGTPLHDRTVRPPCAANTCAKAVTCSGADVNSLRLSHGSSEEFRGSYYCHVMNRNFAALHAYIL